MTELRCKGCSKVLAYIKAGSRIAEGVVMHCEPCSKALWTNTAHGIPAFMREVGKVKHG